MTKLVKGFFDSNHLNAWKYEFLMNDLNNLAQNSGFNLLLLPHVEFTSLFTKAAGLTSTIVQKEFFFCHSRNNVNSQELVLRPELTSGIIRHFYQNKQLTSSQKHNVFSYGHCFRHENPQKGRYRQFLQWNAEQLNFQPENIGKILSLLKTFLLQLGLINQVSIEINYLAKQQLQLAFEKLKKHEKTLPFCQKRFLVKNIYRILDCANCQSFVKNIINLETFLNPQQKEEYNNYYLAFQSFFPPTSIIKKPSLTRGLDYYLGLVFEIKFNDANWSQNTIIAGGSYCLQSFDDKISSGLLGFGFAIGIERLLLFLQETNSKYFSSLLSKLQNEIVIGVLDSVFFLDAYQLQQQMLHLGIKVQVCDKVYSFKDLLIKALKNKTKWVLIFAREFKQEEKIIVRKITNDPKNRQQLLSSKEVLDLFKNNNEK